MFNFKMAIMYKNYMALSMFFATTYIVNAQELTLQKALDHAVQNYSKLQVKQLKTAASKEDISFQKTFLLPNINLMAQQSYGTINAINGPMYAYGGLGSAATSMPLAEQNWNAAFGSLYLTNINWDVFTFGKNKNRIETASYQHQVNQTDYDQEVFQHQIKVTATYLNLLASQRIKYVQERNHFRANVVYETTESRAKSGLIPEVDASLAQAEVSAAQSAQIKAYDKELEFSKQLSVLMGDSFSEFKLDDYFHKHIPELPSNSISDYSRHPFLVHQKERINQSTATEKWIKSHKLPTLSAFGVLQARGSGFDWNYVQNNSAYSSSYLDGIGFDRSNYILGFSIKWNLTDFYRFSFKEKEQKLLTQSIQKEYQLIEEEVIAQNALANSQFTNAVRNYKETEVQLRAASLAFKQHEALYNNGLTTLVDHTQALYVLNRAEIDYEVALNNVWQALLLKAASQGDISIFTKAITN